MTPDEVVSWNLSQARELRGWTQEQAAAALEPHVGARWSKAAFSAAERAWASKRTRHFNADELYALARTFDLPIAFFLVPPIGDMQIGHASSNESSPAPEFLDLVLDIDEPTRRKVQGVLQVSPLRDVLRAVHRWAKSANASVDDVERGIEEALEAAEELSDPKRARRASKAIGEHHDREEG
jgi:hypothetical protein